MWDLLIMQNKFTFFLAYHGIRFNAHLTDILIKCIQEGVRYLMRMLQVRNSVKLNDGVVLHDTATASFLSEGA